MQWELPGAVCGLVVLALGWGRAVPRGRAGLCVGAGGQREERSVFVLSLPLVLSLCLGCRRLTVSPPVCAAALSGGW